MPTEFNTLEEARAEILRLENELTKSNTERDNYSTRINELERDLNTVRDLNQEYFLKLRAQKLENNEPVTDPDEPVESCEEFAKTLTI